MSTDINLLTKKKKQRRDLGKILVGLYVVFVMIFLGAVALMVYSIGLNSQVSALSAEEDRLEDQIMGMGQVREDTLVINERLSSIDRVLSSRSSLHDKVSSILDIVPSGFTVSSLTAENDVISMRLSSNDLSAFNSLIEEGLPRHTASDDFDAKVVELGSFSRGDAGYTLNLDFYFTAAGNTRR